MDEIWKDIKGYEGLYQVSNRGRLRGLYRKTLIGKVIPPIILALTINSRGYLAAPLCNRSRKTINVHRIIAETFIPNPSNKLTVNHKNGIKTDNRVENLEWCTQKENVRHSHDTGLKVVKKGAENHLAKLTNEEVLYIRNSDKLQRVLAKELGVCRVTISKVRNRIHYNNI